MTSYRYLLLAAAAACAACASIGVLGADKGGLPPAAAHSLSLPAEGAMPALDGAVEWLNSKPLTAAELRGKVVLVDFWTYSCINWHRTLPYVRAWAEKYK